MEHIHLIRISVWWGVMRTERWNDELGVKRSRPCSCPTSSQRIAHWVKLMMASAGVDLPSFRERDLSNLSDGERSDSVRRTFCTELRVDFSFPDIEEGHDQRVRWADHHIHIPQTGSISRSLHQPVHLFQADW